MNHSSVVIPASRSGSVGIIHLIEENSDIEWIARNATAGPYTVVLPFSYVRERNVVSVARYKQCKRDSISKKHHRATS